MIDIFLLSSVPWGPGTFDTDLKSRIASPTHTDIVTQARIQGLPRSQHHHLHLRRCSGKKEEDPKSWSLDLHINTGQRRRRLMGLHTPTLPLRVCAHDAA